MIHGDAAFAGQGLVAETLNFCELAAYDTGGTMHLIVNNQIGYTTEAEQGRSSLYCTGQAQLLDIPIFHVNGDDPEACVHVMRLATEYRQRFHTDVVIDLVCYRKYGHNEGDEPAFTQPKMYEVIRAHPPVRTRYARQLVRRAAGRGRRAADPRRALNARFAEEYSSAKRQNKVRDPSTPTRRGRSTWAAPTPTRRRSRPACRSERLKLLLGEAGHHARAASRCTPTCSAA